MQICFSLQVSIHTSLFILGSFSPLHTCKDINFRRSLSPTDTDLSISYSTLYLKNVNAMKNIPKWFWSRKNIKEGWTFYTKSHKLAYNLPNKCTKSSVIKSATKHLLPETWLYFQTWMPHPQQVPFVSLSSFVQTTWHFNYHLSQEPH